MSTHRLSFMIPLTRSVHFWLTAGLKHVESVNDGQQKAEKSASDDDLSMKPQKYEYHGGVVVLYRQCDLVLLCTQLLLTLYECPYSPTSAMTQFLGLRKMALFEAP